MTPAKHCKRCGVYQPHREFHRHAATSDGRQTNCKDCAKHIMREARARNPGKFRERARAKYQADPNGAAKIAIYRKKYPERVKAWKRAEYWKNPDKFRASCRAYYWAHKDERAAKGREWKLNNRTRATVLERERQARKHAAPGNGVTDDQWLEILTDWGNTCAYCLVKSSRLTMDHFYPLSLGGAHDVSNVLPACSSCNPSKGNDLIFGWLPRMEKDGRLGSRLGEVEQ